MIGLTRTKSNLNVRFWVVIAGEKSDSDYGRSDAIGPKSPDVVLANNGVAICYGIQAT